MEDFGFDIDGILSPEEAEELFNGTDETVSDAPQETEEKDEVETDNAEVEDDQSEPEEVGMDEEPEEKAVASKDGGASPSVYSSIANALKDDGIFPDFTDDEINAVKTAEDFAELFEKAVDARLDERQQRINAALTNGVQPDTVRSYEQTIQYLDSISEESIDDESEEGENLRKSLIYNDLINRGYTQERATREIEKSFKAGSDIDDAKDALEGLRQFYKAGYKKIQDESKASVEAQKRQQKENAEQFRKMVLDEDVVLGNVKLDKRTRQKVFDSVTKPVYKDPDTGNLLTEVQKFQKENPLEFLKQLGMWFTLTNGGKNTDALVKEQVRVAKNKGIRELERKINSTSFNQDGTLKYAGDTEGTKDLLLSDDWKVG